MDGRRILEKNAHARLYVTRRVIYMAAGIAAAARFLLLEWKRVFYACGVGFVGCFILYIYIDIPRGDRVYESSRRVICLYIAALRKSIHRNASPSICNEMVSRLRAYSIGNGCTRAHEVLLKYANEVVVRARADREM